MEHDDDGDEHELEADAEDARRRGDTARAARQEVERAFLAASAMTSEGRKRVRRQLLF